MKVDGGFPAAVERSRTEAEKGDIYLASTGLNPFFIEGLKTIAFKIYEEVGVPDQIDRTDWKRGVSHCDL